MDIFDFAMQMEKDGEKYFRELAEQCQDKGLTNILTMMADTEAVHYEVLKKMKGKATTELPTSNLLTDVKNVFAKMKEEESNFSFDASQPDLYRKAMDIEMKSLEFYQAKAEETEDPDHKALFQKIANEEKEHYRLFQNITEFVTQPDAWMENSEWHHLDEY